MIGVTVWWTQRRLLPRILPKALMVLMVAWMAVSGCRTRSLDQVVDGVDISATKPTNGINGHLVRCRVVYSNQAWASSLTLHGASCDSSTKSLFLGLRSIGAPGVYETSIAAFKQVMRSNPDPKTNPYAYEIAQFTPTLLRNLMRDPEYPIHPAAFLSVVKDFETGTNLFEWGVDDFMCRTPGMCQNKCFHDGDCTRICERSGQHLGGREKCLQSCKIHGKVCDDRCYGLFQVDPEIENLRLGKDVGSDHPFVLWDKDFISWDFEKVCGEKGLGLIGITGGPDYCALLFWLFVGESHLKCTRFAGASEHKTQVVDGQTKTVYRNPCKDEGYAWSLKNIARGPEAYQQYQMDAEAWKKKYMGFISDDKEVVYGYEHCAVNGYKNHDPYASGELLVPISVRQAAVLDYACKVGVMPSWATLKNRQDCEARHAR